MEQNKVDVFILLMNGKIKTEKLMPLREQLLKLDNSKWSIIQSIKYRNPVIVLIISIFFGWLGIDRFIIGQEILGMIKFTIMVAVCGINVFESEIGIIVVFNILFSIWVIIDWFLIIGKTKDYNYLKICQVIN